MNNSLYDLFPYVYKSTDAKIQKSRSIDKTGWDEVFEPTYTAIEHSHRLLSEWLVDTISLVASMALCIFLWRRKKLLLEYANSITFATFSAQVLYWPFYLLSTWQTMFLLFGKTPEYPSILHCSLLRHFVLGCFQSAGLITVPIAIDHICLVFLEKRLKVFNMVAIQVVITFLELFFTLAHLAVGDITINDICAQWIASPDVFLISMSFNNTLLLFAVLSNFTLGMVQIFEKFVFKKRRSHQHLCINYSFVLLLQSTTELVLSFPLTVRQWTVLLAGTHPINYFCSYGYMFSFSCIFMVPLVSMICIPKFRNEFLEIMRCRKTTKISEQRGKFKFDNVYIK
ncbi:hypothetical protein CRE_07802 [Caenorhabditis remanei]|uniref:Uncharacterized protein n=1 Tax=Caenorhabditis remanei TaxID=31234 RepID=E3NB74_CAERE|nr:hypothetical protein CRE_07802 [Caenorhabditis remanei]